MEGRVTGCVPNGRVRTPVQQEIGDRGVGIEDNRVVVHVTTTPRPLVPFRQREQQGSVAIG